ncbi:MAG: hypothetical protein OXT65_01800 [Alphaproteobacteria bacterium]|nr:hypothetical protein [Alphaproteobacteria bacterium]
MSIKKLSEQYDWLALDIGGVICADTWEMLFLTPDTGLAAVYGIDPETVMQQGPKIWEHFAYANKEENNYWKHWEDALGIEIDRNLIKSLYADNSAIWADSSAASVMQECLDHGMKLAFISNSTSFWFPKQMEMAGLQDIAPQLTHYLSHEVGFNKVHPQGGLRLLADKAENPASVLFVDDRTGNLKAAQELGMTALQYQGDGQKSLADFIRDYALNAEKQPATPSSSPSL